MSAHSSQTTTAVRNCDAWPQKHRENGLGPWVDFAVHVQLGRELWRAPVASVTGGPPAASQKSPGVTVTGAVVRKEIA